jgi:hypothetical protein
MFKTDPVLLIFWGLLTGRKLDSIRPTAKIIIVDEKVVIFFENILQTNLKIPPTQANAGLTGVKPALARVFRPNRT